MAAEKTHDVPIRIGLIYIAICTAAGLLHGLVIPYFMDQAGLLRLAGPTGHIEHLGFGGAAMFGVLGAMVGFMTGVILCINRGWYFAAILFPAIPLAALGGKAAAELHIPFGGEINIVALCVLPVSLTLTCLILRDRTWQKHQQPIRRSPSGKPK